MAKCISRREKRPLTLCLEYYESNMYKTSYIRPLAHYWIMSWSIETGNYTDWLKKWLCQRANNQWSMQLILPCPLMSGWWQMNLINQIRSSCVISNELRGDRGYVESDAAVEACGKGQVVQFKVFSWTHKEKPTISRYTNMTHRMFICMVKPWNWINGYVYCGV